MTDPGSGLTRSRGGPVQTGADAGSLRAVAGNRARMTATQERPARVRRPDAFSLAPPPRRVRDEPRRAPTLGITELMGRRPDLHDVYPPATIAAESVLWSA